MAAVGVDIPLLDVPRIDLRNIWIQSNPPDVNIDTIERVGRHYNINNAIRSATAIEQVNGPTIATGVVIQTTRGNYTVGTAITSGAGGALWRSIVGCLTGSSG